METVDATIVFLPRFTTLVSSAQPFEFKTLPLDVSRYSGVQFQIWRSPMSAGTFKFYMEESLDAQRWVLGASAPEGIEMNSDDAKFCSYSFRLRWFRLKVLLEGAGSLMVTCWAEGLLRGGGMGVWPGAPMPKGLATGVHGEPVPEAAASNSKWLPDRGLMGELTAMGAEAANYRKELRLP